MGSEPTGAFAAVRKRPWLSLLGLLTLLSTVLLLILGSKIGFFLDDWDLVIFRSTPSDWLLPHNEHIIVVPAALYQLSLSVFGMTAMPLHVIAVVLFELSIVLLFFWLRPLVGEPLSVLACAVMLFLGAATADLVWAFQIGYFGSTAAGLGALLNLRSRTRRGDAWACLLLVVSLLFSSMVIPFAAASAVQIYFRGEARSGSDGLLRRAWVVLVPAALFLIWWVGWGRLADNHATLENALKAPLFAVSALGYAGAVLTGLFPLREVNSSYLWALPGLLVAAGIALLLRRRGRIPPEFVIGAVAALAFWLLAGLNYSPGRYFVAGRYQYPSALFLLMILAGAGAGLRPSPRLFKWLVALAVASLAVNLAALIHIFDSTYKVYEGRNLSGMTALDISRRTVSPDFSIGIGTDGGGQQVPAPPYFDAVDRYGSPGWDEDEIAGASREDRERIDQILVRALPVGPVPAKKVVPDPGSCQAAAASPDNPQAIEVDSPLLFIRSARTTLIYVGRFGDGLDAPAWAAPEGTPIGFEFPADRSRKPWRIGFKGQGEVKVCFARPAK
jgi:hypothetical protein